MRSYGKQLLYLFFKAPPRATRSGTLVAPRNDCLPLLPSGPDGVRKFPPHETQPDNNAAERLFKRILNDTDGFFSTFPAAYGHTIAAFCIWEEGRIPLCNKAHFKEVTIRTPKTIRQAPMTIRVVSFSCPPSIVYVRTKANSGPVAIIGPMRAI